MKDICEQLENQCDTCGEDCEFSNVRRSESSALLADFDKFKNGCPWTDDSGNSCMAISCIGWGGMDCIQKNCGLFYLAKFLYG
jgi:hypothetical protein